MINRIVTPSRQRRAAKPKQSPLPATLANSKPLSAERIAFAAWAYGVEAAPCEANKLAHERIEKMVRAIVEEVCRVLVTKELTA
ncbi:hypothetical protein C7W93_15420 [Glaciimonas sp. PCH181]|nr:hypothetical protein C7W93_15420 [Glaciimonas sp. PCH181]